MEDIYLVLLSHLSALSAFGLLFGAALQVSPLTLDLVRNEWSYGCLKTSHSLVKDCRSQ